MKVIFLDFDGVLNSATSFLYENRRRKKHEGPEELCPLNQTLSLHCCAAFQYVLDQYPDVKIVISSTWREFFNLAWLKEKLAEYEIDSSRVIDVTPRDHFYAERGREIQWWLDEHPEVTHYAIIDDNNGDISYVHGFDRFVKTDWERGMGVQHAAELCEKLSNKNAEKVKERVAKEKAEAEAEKAKAPKEEPDNDF